MSEPHPVSRPGDGFITQPQHHYSRLRRSLVLLAIALVSLPLWYYLFSNDLLETSGSSRDPQHVPLAIGLAACAFGVVGALTALLGVKRTGKQAIDLVVDRAGITVRGGRHIPWTSIRSVTSIEYKNTAKYKVLWTDEELRRSLRITIDEGNGEHELKIGLLRYPAKEYLEFYTATLEQFRRNRITVKHQKKWMQT